MALRNLLHRMFIVRKRKALKSTTEASNLRNWEKEYKLEEKKKKGVWKKKKLWTEKQETIISEVKTSSLGRAIKLINLYPD